MENGQRIAAEERLLELEWCALLSGPEGEDARRNIQAAELYAARNGTDLATAIAAVQRMESKGGNSAVPDAEMSPRQVQDS